MKNQDTLYAKLKVLWKKGISNPKEWEVYNHKDKKEDKEERKLEEVSSATFEGMLVQGWISQAWGEIKSMVTPAWIDQAEEKIRQLKEEFRRRADWFEKSNALKSEDFAAEFRKTAKKMEKLEEEYRKNIERIKNKQIKEERSEKEERYKRPGRE